MARSAHNDVLDALLDKIATATLLCVCDTEPTTHAEAFTTYMLATTSLTPGDGNDFNIADDVSGRKITPVEKAAIAISNTGTAAHIAYCNATVVLFVTTCTAQLLTAAGTVTVPTFDINVLDPTPPL